MSKLTITIPDEGLNHFNKYVFPKDFTDKESAVALIYKIHALTGTKSGPAFTRKGIKVFREINPRAN